MMSDSAAEPLLQANSSIPINSAMSDDTDEFEALPSREPGPLVSQKMKELENENSRLIEDDNSPKGFFTAYIQPAAAELLGTAFFVFIGSASAINGGSMITIAIAHGLGLAIVIAGISHCSGGHINPVVTLGVFLSGGINAALAAAYVICQIIGGMLGAACCRGIYWYTPPGSQITQYEMISGGAHALGPGVSVGCGVLCEIILTTFLVMAVLMTAVDRVAGKPFAAIIIGLSVAVDIMVGGTVSGASMNPARSFGPAVAMSTIDSGVWDDHWIYWVGPICGSLVAVAFYRIIFAASDKRLILKDD